MSTDAQYLKDLADEVMCPFVEADARDKKRLYRIADTHDKLVAERNRLRAAGMSILVEGWLDDEAGTTPGGDTPTRTALKVALGIEAEGE